ncbi:MAG TPA: hypothetical protein VGL81_03385 [Polyangiaceae bacterium]|jgi:hypothetical protein
MSRGLLAPRRAPGGARAALLVTLSFMCALGGCHGSDRVPEPAASHEAGGAAPSALDAASTAYDGSTPPLKIPPAAVDAVVNPMHLPAYTGPTGTVEGTVLVRGPEAPLTPGLDVHACPAALDTYGHLFRAGAPRGDGARPLADAIVVVMGYSGFYLPDRREAEEVTIGPRCGYPLRAIAVTFGVPIRIANESRVPFAPYLEGAPVFAVNIAPPERQGPPVTLLPFRADHYSLRDQLQSFVSGDVYVLRQPLHAVTDTAGRFRIEDVPAQKLQVAAQSSAFAGADAKTVDVPAGGVADVELTLTYAPRDAGPTRPPEGPRHRGP